MSMPDYDNFDFQELCEEERQIDNNKPMPDSPTSPNISPTGAIISAIIVIAIFF